MSESAGSQILNGIRRSLRRGELAGPARQAAEARLAAPPHGPAVARARLPQGEKVALFRQWAEAHNANVARVVPADVASEVAAEPAPHDPTPAAAAAPPAPLLGP